MTSSDPQSGGYEKLQGIISRINRQAQDDVEGAVAVGCQGAVELAGLGYYDCAHELGVLVTKLAPIREGHLDPKHYEAVKKATTAIVGALPEGGTERLSLLKTAVKWSTSQDNVHGDRDFNAALGEIWWRMGEREKAVAKLVYAEEPKKLASCVCELNGAERGPWMALGVCHFLALENMRDANAFFDAARQGATRNPLLVFSELLLRTCEHNAPQPYQLLCKKFGGELEAAELNGYVAKIGELYFGLRPPPSLMDMLGTMFG